MGDVDQQRAVILRTRSSQVSLDEACGATGRQKASEAQREHERARVFLFSQRLAAVYIHVLTAVYTYACQPPYRMWVCVGIFVACAHPSTARCNRSYSGMASCIALCMFVDP